MEYTLEELDKRIVLHQKNINELQTQKSRIVKTITSEREKLNFWEEVKKSKQEKLF